MNDKPFKINPIISLAYNMADCSQRYVLFVGAGVSKDAGVPSGWDILIQTLQKMISQEVSHSGKITAEEAEKFYRDKFEEKFGYSDIIGQLFPSNEEQRDYLKSFFKGVLPGEAHRLIAEMVKEKLIKYIITTNFDTLIEVALDDAGLKGQYTVIDSQDDVLTSKPWNKEDVCRIYKIHGTIDKGTIRNTKKDLSRLPKELAKDCLDVLERHGVIVLGYSANEEDKAVSNIFHRRKFKGYTMYWTSFDSVISAVATKILHKQDGILIPIKGASLFLRELRDRIKIAQRGAEQTPEAVAEVRFESMFKSPKPEVEILQTIDRERVRLVAYLEKILSEIDDINHTSLWNGLVKVFQYSHNYLLLMEQIIKYRNEYWEPVTKIFDHIYSTNRSGERYGKDGLINYLFYCLIEVVGAMVVENNKFTLLRSMLDINRLRKNENGIEYILNWNIQANFIEAKNVEEAKQKGNKWIMPRFHYLLGLIGSQDFPLKFDLKTRLIETDLLYFVYSVRNPEDSGFPYWFPRSPVYSSHGAPPFFKKIKYDKAFGAIVAKQLFDSDYETLLSVLKKAKDIIHDRFRSAYFASFGGEDVLNDF